LCERISWSAVSVKEDGSSGRLQRFLYFADLSVPRGNALLRLSRAEKRVKDLSEVFCRNQIGLAI
jgi:hypothetical protein